MTDGNANKPLAFETERFLLRPLNVSDATEEYISWWNDDEIQKSLGGKARNWGQAEAERHIAKFNNKQRFHLGIFVKGETIPIGFFAIFLEPGKIARTNIVVGNKDYWGKGVPVEIHARALDIMFGPMKLAKVYGKIHGRNYPSIYNYKAMGFKAEGVQRQHLPGPDGVRQDVMLFGLLRDEWLERRKVEQEGQPEKKPEKKPEKMPKKMTVP